MHKIKILTIGKTKEAWLDEALAEYRKRLKAIAEIEIVLAKDDAALVRAAKQEVTVVCLDVNGKMMDSVAFSQFLMKTLDEGGARLTIVIGGAEGLPGELREGYPLVSLSQMTFTHQCVRLILVEQIYRAFEIAKGSGYHK
jgi:23S rRNA (pseudouridine1915-N3)-methyltransferase